MTDHPSTFNATDCHREGIQWDARASLHREGAGSGLFEGAKGLRSGSFAELVHHIMLMPERDRDRYYIEKHGDREFHLPEILALASRDDFPAL
ncbi:MULTISPECIES: hypothetical protein [Qipengyuania]|uniref:Uncharacterized protein n=1 Tax=Qipengyuania soli TaxID=2782568 RepID=A0A7S8F6N1_9SPHN|nr:hypothetical protein [Qipengyuania soli]QPD00165.1 hypothetical protein IRL76_06455 [Qipengyuania soli]